MRTVLLKVSSLRLYPGLHLATFLARRTTRARGMSSLGIRASSTLTHFPPLRRSLSLGFSMRRRLTNRKWSRTLRNRSSRRCSRAILPVLMSRPGRHMRACAFLPDRSCRAIGRQVEAAICSAGNSFKLPFVTAAAFSTRKRWRRKWTRCARSTGGSARRCCSRKSRTMASACR